MDAQLIPADSGPPIRLERNPSIIGRKPRACDIVLSSGRVSKIHCMIYETRGRFYVQDLGSANGTLVNGIKITGETELQDRDTIKCGHEQFVVKLVCDSECTSIGIAAPMNDESPLMVQVLDELKHDVPAHAGSGPVDGHDQQFDMENWEASVFAVDSTDSVPDWMDE